MAVFVTGGATWWIHLTIVVLLLAGQLVLFQGGSLRWWLAFLLPVAMPLVIYAYLRAVLLTYVRGGIRWRGTFYSLDELRDTRSQGDKQH